MRRALFVTLAAIAGACSSAPRTPESVPPVTKKPDVVSVWFEPTGEGLSADEPRGVGSLPNGRRGYFQGGYRFALGSDGTVEWAANRFATRIIAAVPIEGGWVFVARDGAVARANDFLGPLTRLGNVPEAVSTAFIGRGRAGVITRSGALYTTNGTAPIARSSLPTNVLSQAGAFVDEKRGAVIAEGGALFATSDAGSTWHAVPTAGEAAWRLDLAQDQIIITTTSSARVLASNDTLVELPLGLEAKTGISWLPPASLHGKSNGDFLGEKKKSAIELTQWARFPKSASLSSSGGYVTSDGIALTWTWDGIVGVDLETGQRITPTANVPRDRGCATEGWGATTAIYCEDGDKPGRVLQSTNGTEFFPVPGLAPTGLVAFSDDSTHAAWLGRCSGPDDSDDRSSLCAFRKGMVDHDITMDFEAYDLVGIHGSSALVSGELEGEEPHFEIIDLDKGTAATPTLPDASDTVLESLDWTDNGLLSGIASVEKDDKSSRVLVIGAPSKPLETRALPEGAISVGFLDGERGVAAGRRLSELWYTEDGGNQWKAAPTPVSGSSAGVPLLHSNLSVRCRGDGCKIGYSALVTWSAASSDEGLVLANERETLLSEDNVGDFCLNLGGDCHERPAPLPTRGVCELRHGATAADDQARSAAVAKASVTSKESVYAIEIGSGSARARVELSDDSSARSSSESRMRLTWQPRPGASWSTTSAPQKLKLAMGPDDTFALVATDERQALVVHCTEGNFAARCSLLRAESKKGLSIVAILDDTAAPPNTTAYTTALLLPDGGAMLLVSRVPQGLADDVVLPVIDVVVALRPDGTVAGRRSFSWTAWPRRRSALALRGGVAGYVASSPVDVHALSFFALGKSMDAGAEPFGDLPSLRLPLCSKKADNAAKDKLVTTAFARSLGIEGDAETGEMGVASFELEGGARCLRTFDAPAARSIALPDDMRAELATRHLEVREGALVGTVRTKDGVHDIGCTPAP